MSSSGDLMGSHGVTASIRASKQMSDVFYFISYAEALNLNGLCILKLGHFLPHQKNLPKIS